MTKLVHMGTELLGCPYPLRRNSKGYLHTITGPDTIRADILILMLTNPGERVMMPTFGTNLRALCFEPADNTLVNQAKNIISNAIKQWEPRVAITNLSIVASNDQQTLTIQVEFVEPDNIQSLQLLTVELPLGSQ